MVLEGDYFEAEPTEPSVKAVPKTWVIRRCEWYIDEYKECMKMLSRLHQYFIFGENTPCFQWKIDYDDCLNWRNNRDMEALYCVVKSEDERFISRMKASQANDVWTYRSSPPRDWNKPLPDFMEQRRLKSTLLTFEQQRQQKRSHA